jgi:SOS response associated peptidase (SRAP)
VIRRNHKTGDVSLAALRWGLIPYWCSDPKGGRKPINAKGETVRDLPTFREAYRKRRCIVPVDGFFEWKAIKGQKAKQPYAIAMKDGAPFGIAGITAQGIGAALSPTVARLCRRQRRIRRRLFDAGRGGGGRAVVVLVCRAGDQGRRCCQRRSSPRVSASSRDALLPRRDPRGHPRA